MTAFKHTNRERLAPDRVAERLVDLAYALTGGGPVELNVGGERIRLPVPAEVVLVSASESNGSQVELDLKISWPT